MTGRISEMTTMDSVSYTHLDVYKRQNLMSFQGDPWVLGPICAAIVAGGVGFPVFHELKSRWRRPVSYTHLDVYKRQV